MIDFPSIYKYNRIIFFKHSSAFIYTRQRLNQLNPAVIAFDLSETNPGLDLTLLRNQPGLQLIDACSYKLMGLSSHSAEAHSVADLINFIQ